MDEILGFKHAVVWDKGPIGMGWHYRRSYEFILVSEPIGGTCNWYDETDQVENIIRGINKIIPSKNSHPTPKPKRLMAKFIQYHTKPDDIVFDPFMGSGTTCVAAKEMGRRFIGIDIEPKYVEIAKRRLEQEYLPL